jgi:pimeloyl-ACP methyl ester carboxylesterase
MIQYPWQVGGTLTRVLEAGRGDVATVLLHGVGARADRWRNNLEHLADAGLHVFALDLPGHGFAAKGSDFADYTVGGYADFVTGFLNSIQARRAVLVGTSLGGHIAAKVTCRTPKRVAGLIMVGTLGLVPLGPEWHHRFTASLSDTSEAGIRRKLAAVIHDPALITDDWVAAECRINNSPGAAASFAAIGAYFRDHLDDDLVDKCLGALHTPPEMLIIWGAEDMIVTKAVGEQSQARLGPAVSLMTIPSTGHAPYLESPAEFNEMVTRFLHKSGVLLSVSEPLTTTNSTEAECR